MSACGWSRRHCSFTHDFRHGKRPAGSPLHDVRQHAGISDETRRIRFSWTMCRRHVSCCGSHFRRWRSGWWSQSGLNRRPHACKARALPAELWPQFRFGPPSLKLRRDSLRMRSACRAKALKERRLVGLGRLELPTSRLSSARSNQLSYKPENGPDDRAVRSLKKREPARARP